MKDKKIKVRLKKIIFHPAYDKHDFLEYQKHKEITAYETIDIPGLCIHKFDGKWAIGHIKSGCAISGFVWDGIKGPLEMISEWLNHINWNREYLEIVNDKEAERAVSSADEHIMMYKLFDAQIIVENN